MNKQLSIIGFIMVLVLAFGACEPLPTYETKDVTITSTTSIISSGYIEQVFSTDKDAYYLIGIQEADNSYDPLSPNNQKPFMTYKLDEANEGYIEWRKSLLVNGEFTIASFASHCLQYGKTDYYFTGLKKNTEYWIYAFVVDPERMSPKGKLNLVSVTTTESSSVDVHFEFRVKGSWDYIYPMDTTGKIFTHYPYIMEQIDSAVLVKLAASPKQYFEQRLNFWIENPQSAHLLYGVYAHQNFEFSEEDMPMLEEYDLFGYIEGHTYYTFICGYDDGYLHPTIYKYKWKGEGTKLYFKDTEQENLYN